MDVSVLVQLIVIVSVGQVSIVIVRYKRVSVNNYMYIVHLVHPFIDIDSHEEFTSIPRMFRLGIGPIVANYLVLVQMPLNWWILGPN